MLTVADVYAYVNGRAPFDTQMDFDNAGLLTGAMDQPVTGIHVALDCTEGVIQEAERLGANLIVTHHPLMFHARKCMTEEDAEGRLLSPFRTWRNTMTAQAAEELTGRFGFNIPQRWSIAHLYQAILNGEEHVKDIVSLTTLAGYVHYKLTGVKALGVGEASGMFPIDSGSCDYDQAMVDSFDALVADKGYPWKLRDILPKVLPAGADAGSLTPEGAKLLDPAGALEPGCPVAPPEGDAGTGMAATNAVAPRTGNVSAGTSVFAMIVLEKALSKVYPEIDMVTTPTGKPVAMVHCNNCTNEINAWAKVFKGFLEALGQKPDMNAVYTAMFQSALRGEKDAGGLVLFNFLSGEPVAGMAEGRPLLVRSPEAKLNFANFMAAQLYSAVAALKLGMDILAREHVAVDRLLGHGGYFKTPEVGQRIMAAAMAGGCLGFLVWNFYPAKVFMGDTGSLGLGGFAAAMAAFGGNLLYIAVIGVMFVCSGISVILQVIYYKKTKKRLFRMAPLHHHLQKLGYSESKIAFMYSLITAAAGLLCLAFAM